MKVDYVDQLGREHVEVGGNSFTTLRIIPFEIWIKKTYGSYDKFQNLSKKDKEIIFLRWKWGSINDSSNLSIEFSERQSLSLVSKENIEEMKEDWKFFYKHKIKFDEYCKEVKERIGLSGSNIVDDEVKKIKDAFNAEEF